MNVALRISQLFMVLLLLAYSVNGYAAPALFKIEKQGASSYLFGTVHVGDASMKGLPQKVTHALDNSNQVVVEVDISKLSPLQMQQRSMPFMLLTNGRTLQSELSEKNYQQLKDYFAKKSIDIAMFSNFKPWAVMLTIMQIEFQNAGYSDKNGIDKQILEYAQKHNIDIAELETVEQQLQMFDGLESLSNAMMTGTLE